MVCDEAFTASKEADLRPRPHQETHVLDLLPDQCTAHVDRVRAETCAEATKRVTVASASANFQTN
eukprot:6165053-Pyramimonas_sp.AAC.2